MTRVDTPPPEKRKRTHAHTFPHTQANTKNRAVSSSFQRFKRPNPSSVGVTPKGICPRTQGEAWFQRGNGFSHPGSQSQPAPETMVPQQCSPSPLWQKGHRKPSRPTGDNGRRTWATATDPGLRSAEAQRPNTSALHHPCDTDTSPGKWDYMVTPWQNGAAR